MKETAKKYLYKTIVTKNKGLDFLGALADRNIDYVALKGFSLLSNNGQKDRIMRDIDILVNKESIADVISIATQYGFKFQNHKTFNPSMIDPLSRYYDLPNMVDELGVCLEIHFRIDSKQRMIPCSISSLMLENASSINVNNKKIKVSSMELSLIHILFHASIKGNFDAGIQVISDLVYIFENKQINYYELEKHINSLGFINEFSPFFLLLQSKKIGNIPESLTNSSSHKKCQILKDILVMAPVNNRISKIYFSENMYELFTNISSVLFVRKSEIEREFSISSKSILFYFYYLRRWIRQVNQFFLRIIRQTSSQEISKREVLIKKYFDDTIS